jgi:transcriptional regulator with XRE-family HTH domain
MSEETVTDALRDLWERKPPTVTECVKALRIALDDTQQEFAQRLGLAISTVVRYESTRAPRGVALMKLTRLAGDNGLVHIVEMFRYAISSDAGLELKSLEDRISALKRRQQNMAAAEMYLKLVWLGHRLNLVGATLLRLSERKKNTKSGFRANEVREIADIVKEIKAMLSRVPFIENSEILIQKKREQYPEMDLAEVFHEVVTEYEGPIEDFLPSIEEHLANGRKPQ